jgi:hypothetical protein
MLNIFPANHVPWPNAYIRAFSLANSSQPISFCDISGNAMGDLCRSNSAGIVSVAGKPATGVFIKEDALIEIRGSDDAKMITSYNVKVPDRAYNGRLFASSNNDPIFTANQAGDSKINPESIGLYVNDGRIIEKSGFSGLPEIPIFSSNSSKNIQAPVLYSYDGNQPRGLGCLLPQGGASGLTSAIPYIKSLKIGDSAAKGICGVLNIDLSQNSDRVLDFTLGDIGAQAWISIQVITAGDDVSLNSSNGNFLVYLINGSSSEGTKTIITINDWSGVALFLAQTQNDSAWYNFVINNNDGAYGNRIFLRRTSIGYINCLVADSSFAGMYGSAPGGG